MRSHWYRRQAEPDQGKRTWRHGARSESTLWPNGRRIHRAREDRGLSSEELVHRRGFRLPATISYFEAGQRKVGIYDPRRIAGALGRSLAFFFDQERLPSESDLIRSWGTSSLREQQLFIDLVPHAILPYPDEPADSYVERYANWFVSGLLMLGPWLDHDVRQHGVDVTVLARCYDVSEQVPWIRLLALRPSFDFAPSRFWCPATILVTSGVV